MIQTLLNSGILVSYDIFDIRVFKNYQYSNSSVPQKFTLVVVKCVNLLDK